jgi:formiminoglutamase
MSADAWLTVARGNAPLLLSVPHGGTEIPAALEARLHSVARARHDADWWVPQLYDFAPQLGVTMIRTDISRTVIDVNRDPGGASLYPGQATTELCPTTTFDGEPLYAPGSEPGAAEIAARRAQFFDPYHVALAAELERLRALHGVVVLYDAHSIRSRVPRLFDGLLPIFNIGTHSGASCAAPLAAAIESICAATGHAYVINGRFKGGYITRHYGRPERGVHAVQMELACRSYLRESDGALGPENWPVPYDPSYAAPIRAVLSEVLQQCLQFARKSA